SAAEFSCSQRNLPPSWRLAAPASALVSHRGNFLTGERSPPAEDGGAPSPIRHGHQFMVARVDASQPAPYTQALSALGPFPRGSEEDNLVAKLLKRLACRLSSVG